MHREHNIIKKIMAKELTEQQTKQQQQIRMKKKNIK